MTSVGIECSVRLEVGGEAIQFVDVITVTESLYDGCLLRTRLPGYPELNARSGDEVRITFQAFGAMRAHEIRLYCLTFTRYEDATRTFYELEAVDPLYLLAMERQFITYRGKRSLAGLIKDVLERHLGGLGGNIPVNGEAPSIEAEWLFQCHESGTEFITRIARTYGKAPFWSGTSICFKDIASPKDADGAVKLVQGESLVSSRQQVGAGTSEITLAWTDPVTRVCQISRVEGNGLTSAGASKLGRRASTVGRPDGKTTAGEGRVQSIGESLHAITTQSELTVGRSVQKASGATYYIQSITHLIQAEGSYSNSVVAVEPRAWGIHTPRIGGRLVGPFSATVVENSDPNRYGRIRVRLDEDRQSLTTPWISLVAMQAGASRGWYWLPEVGDRVIVMAPEDCPENMIVWSSIRGDDSQSDQAWTSTQNAQKVFAFRNGVQIRVDDENELIRLQTKSGFIELGPQGKLLISAKDIEVRTDNTIDIVANGIVKLDGQQIHLGT